jgi:hypothetical protein
MHRTPFLHPSLLARAGTQRGVFTAEQARQLGGHTVDDLQWLRRRRHLVALRRGVYALNAAYEGADPATQHGMRVAALGLALTAPATLSHESAATELGLELLDPDVSSLHVTRPIAASSRREAGVIHHAAELPEQHVVRRDGLLDLTTLARTAIDVGRATDRFECAVAALDSALRMGVPAEELRDVFTRCRSWPGARMLSGALPIADGRADNPGESWSRVILIRLGLAPTDLQVRLEDEDGLIGYADFGWGDDVVGELDGKGKYGIGVDTDPVEAVRIVRREKRREDRIRGVGREVARWEGAHHYHPGVIGQRVRGAMARAAQRRRPA